MDGDERRDSNSSGKKIKPNQNGIKENTLK